MSRRVAVAAGLGLREQARRPLLVALLVGLPFFFITRAIAETEPAPRRLPLPDGTVLVTTMREVHGAVMAAITIAFLAGLCGVFVIASAREADRRLVAAGFPAGQAVAARLLVLATATLVVLAVSLAVTALSFTPRSWPAFAAATLLVGLAYGGLGALAGAALGKLGATYLVLFLSMLDLGVAQNPMFGDGNPDGWARLLPGYGPARTLVEASFAARFDAWGELALSAGWAALVVLAVAAALARSLELRPANRGASAARPSP